MNTVELLQFSVGNAFGLLADVTADLTPALADWTPPGIANPVGASYWHAVAGTDEIVHRWAQNKEPLLKTAGWEQKVLLAAPPETETDELARMRATRVDLAAMHDYAHALASVCQEWLGSLAPEDLERTLDTPIGPMTLGKMLETFVAWHINAHCGEISALKGCQGAKGYPF